MLGQILIDKANRARCCRYQFARAATSSSIGNESSVGCDAGAGLTLAKEKNRIVDLERGTEEPGARPSELSLEFPAHLRGA
jgi:hypothetical protein